MRLPPQETSRYGEYRYSIQLVRLRKQKSLPEGRDHGGRVRLLFGGAAAPEQLTVGVRAGRPGTHESRELVDGDVLLEEILEFLEELIAP